MHSVLSALLCCLTLLQTPVCAFPDSISQTGFNSANIISHQTDGSEATSTETADSEAAGSETAAINIASPSAVLMEAATGTIIYEKDSHTRRAPASVTKIMTLLLIFDALEDKTISLEDPVTVSEYAAGMGGSQVFLEAGEVQSVNDLIKCISIASANDACVVMAEHLRGSEEAFVAAMNERAKELGMNDTTFVNCCGLTAEGHVTSAYDIALMSRELIIRYPQIHDYCTVWMDTITHTTARGSSEFGLTNTNKLVRHYEYATGLKTGFTDLAMYCISATAEKDGLNLISVIMAAPDAKTRTKDAVSLFGYGFSNVSIYRDDNADPLPPLPVKGGLEEEVPLEYESEFEYLDTDSATLAEVTKEIALPEEVPAPVKKGDTAGTADYYMSGTKIGSIRILYSADIPAAAYRDYFFRLLTKSFFCI